MFQMYTFIRPLGVFCVFIACVTWGIDWIGWVEPCTYCRFQRSIIGMLGIFLIYRRQHALIEYTALLIGSFGIYLASRQFMDNYLQSFFTKPNFYLSGCSLMLQVAALYILLNLKALSTR